MNSKTMIILITLIVIVIIICLTLLHVVNKYSNSDYSNTEFEQQIHYEEIDNINLLDNVNKSFVIQNILDTFTSSIKEINGDMEYDLDIEESEAMKAFLEEGITIMDNILALEYKEEMNITRQRLIQIAGKYNNYDYIIDKIYVFDKAVNIDIYIVNAFLGSEELNMIIKLDTENETFSIFLEDYMEKYKYNSNMNVENINIEDTLIEENEYNRFEFKNITDKQVAYYYLKNYINMAKYQTRKAYELLDEEYKNKKFPTYESFKKYIEEKEDAGTSLKGYKIIKGDDYNLYMCEDRYNFIYIFKQNALMDYTVMLDDYTIQLAEVINSYEEQDRLEKGANNIIKFFEMINMKDYKTAYEKLDSSFKQANFENEQSFETYIKQNTFKVSDAQVKTYGEVSDTYVYNIMLTDMLENSEKEYNYKIVVKLLENADFTILFEKQ